MSSTTKTTCDGCGAVSTDGAPEPINSFYQYGKSYGHFCEKCWTRGLRVMLNVPALDVDAAVKAATEQLRSQVTRLELRCAGLDNLEDSLDAKNKYIDELRADVKAQASRIASLDHALAQERTALATAAQRHMKEVAAWATALDEALRMIGKKARAKHSTRIAEFEAVLSNQAPTIPLSIRARRLGDA